MKNIFFAICSLLIVSQINAQKPPTSPTITRESLLKDPNILWVGESYSSFLLDETNKEKLKDSAYLNTVGIKNNVQIQVLSIKNLDIRDAFAWDDAAFQFKAQLLATETINKGSFYLDDNCTQKLSAKEALQKISVVDTIITFDPETFQEITQVVVNSLDPNDITHYKVKHLIYYNQKTNSFGTLMEALAPMLRRYDKKGKFLEETPIFWIKIDNKSTIQDLGNMSMNWARRTIRTFNFDECKALKSTKTQEECIDLFVKTISKNAKTEDVRNTMGNFGKLSEKEIANLSNDIDTVITFDPVSFQEIVQTVTSSLNAKDVKRFRFVQEWYWDYKQHKLMLHTQFFAPIIQRYDDNAKFLNEGPLLWKPVK